MYAFDWEKIESTFSDKENVKFSRLVNLKKYCFWKMLLNYQILLFIL